MYGFYLIHVLGRSYRDGLERSLVQWVVPIRNRLSKGSDRYWRGKIERKAASILLEQSQSPYLERESGIILASHSPFSD